MTLQDRRVWRTSSSTRKEIAAAAMIMKAGL